MSFLKRAIDVTIKLKNGFFKEGGDTFTVTNHRVACSINSPGGESQGNAHVVIWGLSQDLMNQLTAIGVTNSQNLGNQLIVAAGTIDKDGKRDMAIAYTGTISASWADYTNQPDAMLQVVAWGALMQAITPVGASSYEGSTAVESIMFDLAQDAGLTLDNHGVSAQIDNCYLSGSTLDKIQALSRAANIKYDIDETNNRLLIMPIDGNIIGDQPLISPSTGMVGYPAFTQSGIVIKSLYNRHITNNTKIQLESSIPAANGEFTAFDVTHTLESENPSGNGAWFTDFRAFRKA